MDAWIDEWMDGCIVGRLSFLELERSECEVPLREEWEPGGQSQRALTHPPHLFKLLLKSWRSGLVSQWNLSLLRDTPFPWQGFPHMGGHQFLGSFKQSRFLGVT